MPQGHPSQGHAQSASGQSLTHPKAVNAGHERCGCRSFLEMCTTCTLMRLWEEA